MHILVKVGGAAVGAGDALPAALDDVCALVRAGHRVTVVHGGGPEITRWAERLGLAARFVQGLRYSDADTVAIAEMALARVGKAIAAALTVAGVPAVSLGGRDGGVLTARPARRTGADGQPLDLGLVGEVAGVRRAVLDGLAAGGLLPVLASVAPDAQGELYNVNADDAAADIAVQLGCDVLILASDVPGVLVDGRPVPTMTPGQAQVRIADGTIGGGMRPKVEACLRAVGGGVGTAWIVDGRKPGTVQGAAAGDAAAGTAFGTGASAPGAEAEEIIGRYSRRFMHTYTRAPIVLAHGSGTRVWDADGRAYLDFLCGISVNNLGHRHPRVVAAIKRQVDRLAHTSNLYYTQAQLEVAEELAHLGFEGLAFFANSGAEANEAALKLARKAAWRRAREAGTQAPIEIVSFNHAFHGRTYGALAVTRAYQEGFGPMLAGFRELPWNDVAAARAGIGPEVAGVIVEPVQGEGGVRVAAPEFLAVLREACDRHGACLIFDEIQCGLGRAGANYAFQHFGVAPDVVTLGKALGAGLPMGAVLARGGWASALRPSDHGTTFGGNPVVAAAAAEGLRVLREEGLAGRARELGAHLRGELSARFSATPVVREVRGLGLMCGIELDGPAGLAVQVVDGCRERGLLINATAGNVVRVMPPLTVSAAEIDEAVAIIAAALAAALRSSRAG